MVLYVWVEVSFLYFNYLVSVTAGGPESPRGHIVAKFYGRLQLIWIVWEHQNFPC